MSGTEPYLLFFRRVQSEKRMLRNNGLTPPQFPQQPPSPLTYSASTALNHSDPSLLHPDDVVQLRVVSQHTIPTEGEICRIIGVAAGESLYFLYQLIIAVTLQKSQMKQDILNTHLRTKRVWYLHNTWKYNTDINVYDIQYERNTFLYQLPLKNGYKFGFATVYFIYHITVDYLLVGVTHKFDLNWVSQRSDSSQIVAVIYILLDVFE